MTNVSCISRLKLDEDGLSLQAVLVFILNPDSKTDGTFIWTVASVVRVT